MVWHCIAACLFVPLGYDHGGGQGAGAFALYNIDDPKHPQLLFDTRDHMARYHTAGQPDYVGDFAEAHSLAFRGDQVLMSERGKTGAGFSILDLAPAFDNDPETLPAIVGRFAFPKVGKPTNYDGFSFSPAWSGRYVYAPTGSHGLYIVDTLDPSHPRLVAHLPKASLYDETLRSAVVIGDLLVLSPAAVASNDGSLVLVDVSNPARPSLLGKHPVRVGYQGFVYGSVFYNGGTRDTPKSTEPNKMIAYDFADPAKIVAREIFETDQLKNPEYGFVIDDELFIGHYPGLSKWRLSPDGKAAEFVSAIEPQFPPADDYAFISPVGNLAVVTSDHNVKSRLNIGVHSREPDTQGPRLIYTRPVMNAAGVDRHTGIGLAFSDFIDPLSLTEHSLQLRVTGTEQTVAMDISHMFGVVNLVPHQPLQKGLTYEVVATTAITDQVGNPLEADNRVLLRFSTGQQAQPFNALIQVDQPQPVGAEVHLTATLVSGGDSGVSERETVEYAWDFADGTPTTDFSPSSAISHRYQQPGNYPVTLSVKQTRSGKISRFSKVQVIHHPLASAQDPALRPQNSSSVISAGTMAYVVNPDNHTLTGVDLVKQQTLFETATGNTPSAVALFNNSLWVTNKDSHTITRHEAKTGQLQQTLALEHGAMPHGIVANAKTGKLYVALTGKGQLLEIDAGNAALPVETTVINIARVSRRLSLGSGDSGLDDLKTAVISDFCAQGSLRHLALAPAKNQLLVPQFLACDNQGNRLAFVDTGSFSVTNVQTLAETQTPDDSSNGSGFPNYLNALAISPDQTSAWMPAKKDNLNRGQFRNGQPLSFEHTVRAMAARIDLGQQREDFAQRLDFDNSGIMSAATFSPVGNRLFLSSLGSSSIWVIDAYDPNDRVVFDSMGLAPIGMTVTDSGEQLLVHNFMSRSLSVFDITDPTAMHLVTTLPLVAQETLTPDVLAGKQLFYDSRSPELSQEGYMSCASCHIDGSHDGRVWDMTHLGEGLRNTIDLRGKAGLKHGPLHWSANFDEVQDFENQIRTFNQGQGLMADGHFAKTDQSLGSKKQGLSPALDHLAAYVESLNTHLNSPHRHVDGSMTASALRGRQHFIEQGCHRCHRGDEYTDSVLGRLHDMGTVKTSSGQRLGANLAGIDTPSLIGLWQSAPFLHDGSASTLAQVFDPSLSPVKAAMVESLSPQEQSELLDFLQQLQAGEGIKPEEIASVAAAKKESETAAPATTSARLTTTQSPYSFNWHQGADKQTPIGKIAVNADTKIATPRFYLQAGQDAGLFTVDAVTGELFYKGLDLYGDYVYQFNVVVEDRQQPWQPTVVPVTVTYQFSAPAKPEIKASLKNGNVQVVWQHTRHSDGYRILVGATPDTLKQNRTCCGKRMAKLKVGDRITSKPKGKYKSEPVYVQVIADNHRDNGGPSTASELIKLAP